MKAKYKVTEVSGAPDRQSFTVQISVELDAQEQELSVKYGIEKFIAIDERFNNLADVGPLGHVGLDSLLDGIEVKIPTIKLAFNFVSAVLDGLRKMNAQLRVTRDNVATLAKEVEITLE